MGDRTSAELHKLVAQARNEVEGNSKLVGVCEKRIGKWVEVASKHRRNSAAYKRANRKLKFWRRRKHHAIYLRAHWQHTITDLLAALARKAPGRLLRWAEGYLGVHEGSTLQRTWAAALGYSAALPWCSIFVANGVRAVFHLGLPANPAYSGSWMAWKNGRRISISRRRKDDLLIYDWGDGGMTDHVAICDGKGGRVGGNQSDAVTRAPEDAEFIVAVIRPRT